MQLERGLRLFGFSTMLAAAPMADAACAGRRLQWRTSRTPLVPAMPCRSGRPARNHKRGTAIRVDRQKAGVRCRPSRDVPPRSTSQDAEYVIDAHRGSRSRRLHRDLGKIAPVRHKCDNGLGFHCFLLPSEEVDPQKFGREDTALYGGRRSIDICVEGVALRLRA